MSLNKLTMPSRWELRADSANHACPPGKVGQVALVTAMHRGRWYGTTGAACIRRRRRQLEPHGVLFNGDFVQVHVGS
jgi:hypothetical protein